MKNNQHRSRTTSIGTFFCIITLSFFSASCGGSSDAAGGGAPAAAANNVAGPSGGGAPSGPTGSSVTTGNLFIANISSATGEILEYAAPYASGPIETITDGINYPASIAFDSAGDLFVANSGDTGYGTTVTEYASGSNTIMNTITNGIDGPTSIAIDSSNNLFVSNAVTHAITEYAYGSSSPSRTITNGIGNSNTQICVDPSGNLFVADGQSVIIYSPGALSPTNTIVLNASGSNYIPATSVVCDKSGNLFVSSQFSNGAGGVTTMQVIKYSPGVTAGNPKYLGGISQFPWVIGLDSAGDFFAVLGGSGPTWTQIAEIAAGATSPELVITGNSKTFSDPRSIVVDNSGNLLVADSPSGSVYVYPKGSSTVSATITGIAESFAMGISP